MAGSGPPNTYVIPPPPLPEFYIRNADGKDDDSSHEDSQALAKASFKVKTKCAEPGPSQQSHKHAACSPPDPLAHLVETVDDKMMTRYQFFAHGADAPAISIPPPPPLDSTNDVPPLAIYHICRICLRPRSGRYHQEHPIPINGVPPPPGICKRCRITTVEDKTFAGTKVVKLAESNEIRIGIGCIVPDEDYVSNTKMRERRKQELLRSIPKRDKREESSSSGEDRKIVYRHVRLRETCSTSPPKRSREDSLVYDQCTTTAVAALSTVQGDPFTKALSRASRAVKATEGPPVNGTRRSITTEVSRSHSQSVAKEPAENVERTESNIRKIARDEVERYRQAERRIAAHPEPFAHGRMVPIERRGAVENLTAQPASRSEKRPVREERVVYQEVEVQRQSPRSPQLECDEISSPVVKVKSERTQELDVEVKVQRHASSTNRSKPRPHFRSPVKEEASHDREPKNEQKLSRSSQAARSGRPSWAPQWLQDLPAEPAEEADSTETLPRSKVSEKKFRLEETKAKEPHELPRSDYAASGKLKEVYRGHGDEYRPRINSAKDAPAVTEVWLPAADNRNVFEVIEEIEVPERRDRTRPRVFDGLSSDKQASFADGVSKPKGESTRLDRMPSGSMPTNARQSSTRSSRRTDREYWYDGGVARTASGLSSHQQESDIRERREEERYGTDWGPHSLSERMLTSPSRLDQPDFKATSRRSKESQTVKGPRYTADEAPPRDQGAEDVREQRPSVPSGRTRVQQSAQSPSEYIYTEHIVQPAGGPVSASARSQRSARSPDSEYIYTERRTEPAARAEKNAQDLDIETSETFVHRKRDSGAEAPKPRPQQRERQERTNAIVVESNHSSQAKASNSNHSSRVRFASKIKISPTPPDSDASSQQFRTFASRRAKHAKGFDERGEELIEEYERRGRSRSREPSNVIPEGDYRAELLEVREWEREETPRPNDRQTSDKKSSVSSRQGAGRFKDGRPIAQAFSESP